MWIQRYEWPKIKVDVLQKFCYTSTLILGQYSEYWSIRKFYIIDKAKKKSKTLRL